jgi:hypothetical protein
MTKYNRKTNHIKIVMQNSQNSVFEGVYMAFMGFVPTMTHLFDYEKLNPQFNWFLKPDNFCDKYLKCLPSSKDFYPKTPRMFIHNLGQLRSLTDYELRNNHFWFNMIDQNQNLFTHLKQMKVDKLFPYLPFIIKPNIKISIDKAVIKKFPNCEYNNVSIEIRLFPQSVTGIHLNAYFKGPFTTDDLVYLGRKFKYQRILILNEVGSKKLELKPSWKYSIHELFNAIKKTIWKTLYRDKIGTVDESAELVSCRMINPLAKFELTNRDMTSLTTLSKNPKHNEIIEALENKLEKTKDPTDVITYHDYTLLIYAPKNTPRELQCLRNNCINVTELTYVQDFFLSRVVDQFDKHNVWSSYEKKNYLLNLDYSAISAIVPSFSKHRENLHGIHRRLYMLISSKTKHQSLEKKILMSYKYSGLAKEIESQLKEPQKYLETIIVNSTDKAMEDLFDIGAVRSLQRKGDNIISAIKTNYVFAEQEEGKSNCNYTVLQNALMAIDFNINEYKMDYLPRYKNLVKELVGKKEEVKQKTEEKRKEGKKVPEKNTVEKLLDIAKEKLNEANKVEADVQKEDAGKKPKSFFEKAKPYLGAIASGAGAILKALGYI